MHVGRIVRQDAIINRERVVVFVSQFGQASGHELRGDVIGHEPQGGVDHFLGFAVLMGIDEHTGQLEIGVGIVDAAFRGVTQVLDGLVGVAGNEQHAADAILDIGIVGSDGGGTDQQLPRLFVVPFLARLAGLVGEADGFIGRTLQEIRQPAAAGR